MYSKVEISDMAVSRVVLMIWTRYATRLDRGHRADHEKGVSEELIP